MMKLNNNELIIDCAILVIMGSHLPITEKQLKKIIKNYIDSVYIDIDDKTKQRIILEVITRYLKIIKKLNKTFIY